MDARRFDDLLRLWQDGEASAEELRELDECLRREPALGRELVNSVLLDVNLYRRYAVQAAPVARRRRWEAVAALLVLAVSAVLIARLFLMSRPPSRVEPPPVTMSRRTPGPTPDVETVIRRLDRAKIGLVEALARASEMASGVAVDAELEEEHGSLRWTVGFATGTRVREIELDAVTLKVAEDKTEATDVSAVAAALRVPLASAVAKALEAAPGRAVEVEAELKGGRVVIEIKVLVENELRRVTVDGATGEILKR